MQRIEGKTVLASPSVPQGVGSDSACIPERPVFPDEIPAPPGIKTKKYKLQAARADAAGPCPEALAPPRHRAHSDQVVVSSSCEENFQFRTTTRFTC